MSMDETAARAWIGWRVEHGRLPRTDPVHLFASYGRGEYCAGCGCAIDRNELEYELEWSQPARTVSMHPQCYKIWHTQRPAAEA